MEALKTNSIRNLIPTSYFRYFEFKKCVIITQPKVASRYVEHLYSKYSGISTGSLEIDNGILNIIHNDSNNESDYIKNDIFNVKTNKKEIIFLIRNPEDKLYSALIQILFFNDDDSITNVLLKSYSLISQKSYQYTIDIMQRYYNLIGECRSNIVSRENDFFVKNKNNNFLNETELEYINKFHEYKFYSNFEKIRLDSHLQPTCANLQQILTKLLFDGSIAIEKLKLIDIAYLDDYASYFKSLGIEITSNIIQLHSNQNLYSLVNQLFSNRSVQNTELKNYYSQFIYFENTIYNYLNLIYNYKK